MTAPQRAAIYARISRDTKGERLGVTRQIEECREHATRLGWDVAEVYTDNDISAKSGRLRPGFEQMLKDIENGAIDGLVAWHLDRVLRRSRDLERVLDVIESQRAPVGVSFVKSGDVDLSTASGRTFARILAAIASGESEQKGERVAAKRKQEAFSGRAHTLLGYGYNADRTINAQESQVIREVADRVIAGDSLWRIATDLNDRGVPTPGSDKWTARHVAKVRDNEGASSLVDLIDTLRTDAAVPAAVAARLLRNAGGAQADGSAWTASAVKAKPPLAQWLLEEEMPASDSDVARVFRDAAIPPPQMKWRAANLRAMIRRGTLAGWREYGPGGRGGYGVMVAQGDWTPILTKETVDRIREVTDKSGMPTKGGRKPKHLLSTIAVCGNPGCGAPLGGHTDKRDGKARYQCSSQPGLDRCGKLSIVAEPVDEMVSLMLIDHLVESGVRGTIRRASRPTPSVDAAEKELETLRAQRLTYLEQARDGLLNPEEFGFIKAGLDKRIREAERTLGQYAPSAKVALRGIPSGRRAIEQWWDQATLERKRDVLRLFVDHIVINPASKGGNRFDPDRVEPPKWVF